MRKSKAPRGGRRLSREAERGARETGAGPAEVPRGDRLPDRRRATVLFLLALLVYNANLRPISAGDCYPARFLPFSLWGRGSLTLESVRDVARVGRVDSFAIPFWMVQSPQGWTVSAYPLVTPVLVAPLYLPAVVALRARGWSRDDLAVAGPVMEKASASVLASLSVALMYLLLRRRLDVGPATLLSVSFAFGTSTWVTSSQALWQHGATQFLSLVALLSLTGRQPQWHLALGGAACGLIPFNRPPDLPLALAIGTSALLLAGRRAWPFVVAAVVAALPFAALNWVFYEHIGGAYFRVPGYATFFSGSIPSGLAGLFVSPGKGLFVYSPFLLLLGGRLLRPRPGDGRGVVDACLLAGVVVTVLILARGNISGGFSYGPRFLTGILPALFWLLAPVVRTATRSAMKVFAAGVVVGILIQAVGAFSYPHGGSDAGEIWKWRDAPFFVEARAGLAPPELFRRPPGR